MFVRDACIEHKKNSETYAGCQKYDCQVNSRNFCWHVHIESEDWMNKKKKWDELKVWSNSDYSN